MYAIPLISVKWEMLRTMTIYVVGDVHLFIQ